MQETDSFTGLHLFRFTLRDVLDVLCTRELYLHNSCPVRHGQEQHGGVLKGFYTRQTTTVQRHGKPLVNTNYTP